MAKCGNQLCFHGAFRSKEAAERKEASRPRSYIMRRKIRRQTRWIVVTEK